MNLRITVHFPQVVSQWSVILVIHTVNYTVFFLKTTGFEAIVAVTILQLLSRFIKLVNFCRSDQQTLDFNINVIWVDLSYKRIGNEHKETQLSCDEIHNPKFLYVASLKSELNKHSWLPLFEQQIKIKIRLWK